MLENELDADVVTMLDSFSTDKKELYLRAMSVLSNYTEDFMDRLIELVVMEQQIERTQLRDMVEAELIERTEEVLISLGIEPQIGSSLKNLITVLDAITELSQRDEYESIMTYLEDVNYFTDNTSKVAEILYDLYNVDEELFYDTVNRVENSFIVRLKNLSESAINYSETITEEQKKKVEKVKAFIENNPDTLLARIVGFMSSQTADEGYRILKSMLDLSRRQEELAKDIIGLYVISPYESVDEFWKTEIFPMLQEDTRNIYIYESLMKYVLGSDK